MENFIVVRKNLILSLFFFLLICTALVIFRNPRTEKAYESKAGLLSPGFAKNHRVFFSNQLPPAVLTPVAMDLEAIRLRGRLIALTGFSNSSYFIYKGNPMGYEYELLCLLAKHLKVELEIVVVNDMNQIFNMLNSGEGDLIADNLIVTKDHEKMINFTVAVSNTRQMLIQKKPEHWTKVPPAQLEKMLVRNPIHLIGKEVYVPKASAFYQRLQHLSEEIGGDINIVEVAGNMDAEDLIGMVAQGKIPYSVIDENEALINKSHYKNIDMNTPISFPQRTAWAVRENAPALQKAVNEWLMHIKKQPVFAQLYSKYYLNKKNSERYVSYRLKRNISGALSSYDLMIMKYARELDWDWRLLASLIYQESRFDPKAKSQMGASGLMQLMPATARNFGSGNPDDPEQSIKAGICYIKWLEAYWKKRVPEKGERLKFIVASYNSGHAHIADAQRLALKYKKNPRIWNGHVDFYVLQKSNPKYWNDPVVKYGYCRGKETYDYVNNVLQRFSHYKNLVKGNV